MARRTVVWPDGRSCGPTFGLGRSGGRLGDAAGHGAIVGILEIR
ncbi:hypothetical protein [Streptomyces sp. NPDC001388]